MFNFFCLIKFLADGRPPDIYSSYRNRRRGWLTTTTQRRSSAIRLQLRSEHYFFVLKREKIRENERVGEAAKIQNTEKKIVFRYLNGFCFSRDSQFESKQQILF